MRKTLFLILALPFLVMQSCQKNDQQPLQPTKSNQMIYSRISSADEVFADMEGVLDWYDALYEAGDWIKLSNGNGGIIITQTGTDTNPASKHDKKTTNKYAFAKWCNERLNAGDCLKAGKTGDTYWADVVPC